MIAPDANLLIYAYAPNDPHHEASWIWLETVLTHSEPVGIPIHSIYAFVRVVTNPRSTSIPLSFSAAKIVDSWVELPHVRILYPGERHWRLIHQLSQSVSIRGAQLTDAAVAALAIEFGAIVYTNDRDFARYPGLRWHNPLKPS